MTKNRSLLYALVVCATLSYAGNAKANYHIVDTVLPNLLLGAGVTKLVNSYSDCKWVALLASPAAAGLLHLGRLYCDESFFGVELAGDSVDDKNRDAFASLLLSLASSSAAPVVNHFNLMPDFVKEKLPSCLGGE